jgi:hypothetical protein
MEFIVENKPYTTRPSFKRLTGPLFNSQPDSWYIEQKLNEYRSIPGLVFQHPTAEQAVKNTAIKLQLNGNSIFEIGCLLEEDIVVMHEGKLAAAFVAFPSGWSPDEKAMKTLAEIHGPVADGDELRAASNRIAEMMCNGQGPWYRYVWTVTTNPKLSNHPIYKAPEPDSIDDLYFRFEYQTFDTVTVGETSVFLIKTVVKSFKEYVDTEEKFCIIKNSIDSMSNNVLTYKNLHKIKRLLNSQ